MTEKLRVLEVTRATKDVVFKNVSLDLVQEDRRLVEHFSQALSPGDKLIVTGESGSGKSTLVRALRKIWRDGEGDIEIPSGLRTLCVGQRAHLPRTNLRAVLSSPAPEGTFSDSELDNALRMVGHHRLCSSLPENQAKVDVVLETARTHIDVAFKIWDGQIRCFSDLQRGSFHNYVRSFITDYAENFFDHLLTPYIDSRFKAELAESIDKVLCEKFSTNPLYGHVDRWRIIPLFDIRIRGIAHGFAKFVLQGTGEMLQNMRMDGVKISRKFSGGEQQRIPFAQMLLHKPDMIVIDEGTSALDKDSSLKLYNMVFDALPETIFLSVAHNTHLIETHTLHGHLENKTITVKPVGAPSP